MSEQKIVVERIFRDNTDMVEYRVRICSTHAVDYDVDERVPTKYLAAYVVNSLREYIQSATLDEEVVDRLESFRGSGTYTCPVCGREMSE